MADRRNVQPARRHVRRDQEPDRAITKPVKRAGAHRLVQVAVNRRGVETVLLQRLGQDIDIDLAVTEDDRVGAGLAFRADQLAQSRALFAEGPVAAAGFDLEQGLGDGFRRRRLARHFDANRAGQEHVGDALDLGRHGGREEQRLPGERRQLKNALDIGDEPHVQHPVGLIDDHDLDACQQQLAALEMIQQAARRGNQHIDAPVDQLVLLTKADTANQQRLGQLGVFGIGVEILGHLRRQFARRRQDQAARHPSAGPAPRQAGDQRQREGGRLAGPGLGNAQHIAARQGLWDGLRLNRGGRFIAGFRNGLEDLRVQGKIRKFVHLRPYVAASGRNFIMGRPSSRPGIGHMALKVSSAPSSRPNAIPRQGQ